jgi:hypothetical protein
MCWRKRLINKAGNRLETLSSRTEGKGEGAAGTGLAGYAWTTLSPRMKSIVPKYKSLVLAEDNVYIYILLLLLSLSLSC